MPRIVFDDEEYGDLVGDMDSEKQNSFLEDVADVGDEHGYAVKRIEVVER